MAGELGTKGIACSRPTTTSLSRKPKWSAASQKEAARHRRQARFSSGQASTLCFEMPLGGLWRRRGRVEVGVGAEGERDRAEGKRCDVRVRACCEANGQRWAAGGPADEDFLSARKFEGQASDDRTARGKQKQQLAAVGETGLACLLASAGLLAVVALQQERLTVTVPVLAGWVQHARLGLLCTYWSERSRGRNGERGDSGRVVGQQGVCQRLGCSSLPRFQGWTLVAPCIKKFCSRGGAEKANCEPWTQNPNSREDASWGRLARSNGAHASAHATSVYQCPPNSSRAFAMFNSLD
jgi:hypothetical protein